MGSRLDLLALKSLMLKTRDRSSNVQKCGSPLYPDMDCAALQGALGSGTGVGAWAVSVVLLLAWGKLLPSPDLGYPQSCALPSHDILAGGTNQSQLKNTMMDGRSSVVQGWPDVVKGHMPLAGITHCHSDLLVSFLWPVTTGLCSVLSHTSSPFRSHPSPFPHQEKWRNRSNFLFQPETPQD